ncbi:MAG: precorrin-6y C5,15-methyltransferase (decarboxylating) subunit CbiE [Cyanobacteria bacterium J06632_22]
MTDPMIHIVGMGLEGPESLTRSAREAIDQAEILVGVDRQLARFPTHLAQRWPLGNLQALLRQLQDQLAQPNCPKITILTSGDPLFFGLGRLLLTAIPAEQLTFHPNVSAVQLAFSRLCIPWQQACVVSIHGRSAEPLRTALHQGQATIAVIGDPQVSPAAIAAMVADSPWGYRVCCCENLGSPQENVQCYEEENLPATVAPLHLWVLQRHPSQPDATPTRLGLADDQFARFEDRPGLMTKRPVRVLTLAELDLRPDQVVWDIGAGTGSVSIEIARLSPCSRVYAIEKSAAGIQLIQTNIQRFATPQVTPVAGAAPDALTSLPNPHRIFVGGHGGQLTTLLDHLAVRLLPEGRIVVATTTLESQTQLMNWLHQRGQDREVSATVRWSQSHLEVNLSQSTQVGRYQRMSPLNPVLLTVLMRMN